jgi:hypothetical protein
MIKLFFSSLRYFFIGSELDLNSLPSKNLASSSEIHNILQIVFGVLGSLAALSVVISGISYILSNGDPQKTNKAKNGILYSLVGLAVAILAETIVAFVISKT